MFVSAYALLQEGSSSLAIAAQGGRLDLVQLLVEKRASVNVVNQARRQLPHTKILQTPTDMESEAYASNAQQSASNRSA